MAPPPRNRIDSDTPRPPHDTRQRPASQSEPEGPQRSLCEPTRGATALHLTPASGNEPHITVSISRSRPRKSPTSRSESKDIARTTCEQTTAESGQMCRQNESSARAMLALWVSIWRRARRKSTFGMAWKVAGSAKCATCAFESLLCEHPPTA